MTSFEDQLRRGLADAAQEAPAFDGLRPGSAAPPGPARRRYPAVRALAAAASALVVAGASGAAWLALRDDRAQSASCAAAVEFRGQVYVPSGDLLRVPRTDAGIGSVRTPPCDDGQGPSGGATMKAFRLDGLSPDVALVADGAVWLRQGSVVPEEVRELSRPVLCQGPARTVAGRLRDVDAQVREDFEVTAPYTASLVVDEGAGLPLDDYSSLVLQVQVTVRTTAGTDPSLLRAALTGGRRLEVDVTCSGAAFTATALRLEP